MQQVQEASFTYEDLLSMDDGNMYELHDGKLVCMSPSPRPAHQFIVTELSGELRNCFSGCSARVVVGPMDIRPFQRSNDEPNRAQTVLIPDILVLCDPSRVDDRGLAGAPDLVVEVLSESTRRYDQIAKYDYYQRAGVPEYWIVDPDTKTVSVFRLDHGKYHPAGSFSANDTLPLDLCGSECRIELGKVFRGI